MNNEDDDDNHAVKLKSFQRTAGVDGDVEAAAGRRQPQHGRHGQAIQGNGGGHMNAGAADEDDEYPEDGEFHGQEHLRSYHPDNHRYQEPIVNGHPNGPSGSSSESDQSRIVHDNEECRAQNEAPQRQYEYPMKPRLVRSNSFTLQDLTKHRNQIRDSVMAEDDQELDLEREDGHQGHYFDGHPGSRHGRFGILAHRRMSKSLPELRELHRFEGQMAPNMDPGCAPSSQYSGSDGDYFVVHDIQLRPSWISKSQFYMTNLSFVFSMPNIWRFPYICYTYGGGNFFFAYLILSFFIGFPMLCMEYAVGQLTQEGLISALGSLCPILKGVGVAGALLTLVLLPMYASLNSWTLFYFIKSFHKVPPWIKCNQKWNSLNCIESPSLANLASSSTKFLTVPQRTTETPVASTILSALVNFSSAALSESTTESIVEDLVKSTDPASPYELNLDFSNLTDIKSHISPSSPEAIYASSEFFDSKLLELTAAISLPTMGRVRWELIISLVITWFCVFLSQRKSTFFSTHPSFLLSIVPPIVFFGLMMRSLMLDGVADGLLFLFKPNWDQISQPELWLYACGLVMHSLGVVLGTAVSMSNCNKPHNNVFRDAIFTWFFNLVAIILISVTVFSTMGYLAYHRQIEVSELFHKDPSVAFVVFSELLATLPLPPFWSFFFFITLFIIGTDYQITMSQTFLNSFEEAYRNKIKRNLGSHQLFVFLFCVLGFLLTIIYVTQKSIILMVLVEHYITIIATMLLAFFQLIAFGWFYGGSNLAQSIRQKTFTKVGCCMPFSWSLLAPAVIMGIICWNVIYYHDIEFRGNMHSIPMFLRILVQILALIAFILIPIIGTRKICSVSKSGIINKIATACRPKKDQRVFFDLSANNGLILRNGALLTKNVETAPIVDCSSSASSTSSGSTHSLEAPPPPSQYHHNHHTRVNQNHNHIHNQTAQARLNQIILNYGNIVGDEDEEDDDDDDETLMINVTYSRIQGLDRETAI